MAVLRQSKRPGFRPIFSGRDESLNNTVPLYEITSLFGDFSIGRKSIKQCQSRILHMLLIPGSSSPEGTHD